jgi:bacteriophage N4 adsorption protein B
LNPAGLTLPVAHVLGIATIVVAAVYVLLGFDDLCGDIAFWMRAAWRWAISLLRKYPRLTIEQLREQPEKRIAIMVPCWHEAGILGPMLEFACTSLDYNNYDIFVGVYPNDEETVREVKAAAKRSARVHPVINELPGPTTKAQNLNQMFAAVQREEAGNPYAIVVLHDVEDVIHPLSLRVYNHLMPRFDMVQLPVLPLERPWYEWTSWTYVDEFAENHLKDMVMREAMGSFVPCAGVGCAFGREALAAVGDSELEVFPSRTITEDYQTALRLSLHGYSTILVHQRLGQRGHRYSTAASYVATRAYFPDRLSTAVRQKSRWVAGICLQAWQTLGWRGNAATRYSLYRDRKGLFTNLFALCGYIVIAPVLLLELWHDFDRRVAVPSVGNNHFLWLLLDAVLFLTLWRLLQKAIFVSAVYGSVQGILAIFRQPWGAIINGLATVRALTLFFRAMHDRRDMSWNKTAHVFPSASVLREFRRQLGDVLVEQQKIDKTQLAHALGNQLEGERIGDTLLRLEMVQPRDLVEALAEQHGVAHGTDDDLIIEPAAAALVPEALARELGIVPLRISDGSLEAGVADVVPREQLEAVRAAAGIPVTTILVEPERLQAALERAYRHSGERRMPIGAWLVGRGFISRDALDRRLADPAGGRRIFERFIDAGDLDPAAVAATQRDYFGMDALAVA